MKRYYIFSLFCIMFAGTAVAGTIDINTPKDIVADNLEYNNKDKTITTSGKTTISNKSGQRVTLQDSYMDPIGKDISGENVEITLSEHVFITAKQMTRDNEIMIATKATYTACNNCDDIGNAWEISSSKVEHDNVEHSIEFRNPVLWFYGIPVFWFPIMNYPDPTVKRKSGLLIPDFNSTNDMGTQLNLPLYVALSDTHDFTITGSYLTQEKPLWQLEHRLNAEHMSFQTRGSYTHTQDGENRWHIFNDDMIEMGKHVKTSLFYNRVSDNTYLQKYGFYNSQPYLDSGARTELFAESGYATMEAHVFQELRTTNRSNISNPSGNILPQIHGVYQTGTLFDNTYMSFMGDMLGIQNDTTGMAAQRMIGSAQIISPWTMWGGNRVTFGASTRYDVYNFKNTDMANGDLNFSGVESRFLPSGYVDWSLPLAKTGTNWTQIIQPRARLTLMDRQKTSEYAKSNDSSGALLSDSVLFSDNRYSGYDLWENGSYMDYGVSWSAFNNISGKSAEVFMGQSFDFNDKEDTDPDSGFHEGFSDYVGRVSLDDGDWLGLSTRFRIAEENFYLRHLETVGKIGGRNYITVGHIWAAQFIDAYTQDKTINEVTAGFGVYLTNRLTARFNAIYNITDERFQGHRGGLYYEHPCYDIKFEYVRDNAIKEDYVGNTKLRLQFSLKLNGEKNLIERQMTFSGKDSANTNSDEDFAKF